MAKVVVGVDHDGGGLDARIQRPSYRCRRHPCQVTLGAPVEHYLGAEAARPRAATKAAASEPTVVDVAANGVGSECAAQVGWRERTVGIVGPGVADVAADVAWTGGAAVDG